MNFEFMTIDTIAVYAISIALTGFPVSSTGKGRVLPTLDAMLSKGQRTKTELVCLLPVTAIVTVLVLQLHDGQAFSE